MATEFEELYHPIVGATSDGYGHEPVETPEYQLNRTRNLRQAYAELKADLLEEVNMVDSRIVRPAMSARDCIKPLKKTIKSRDNKRLDYENYQDRLDKKRKQKRTEKDEAAYVKLEGDLDKAAAVRFLPTRYLPKSLIHCIRNSIMQTIICVKPCLHSSLPLSPYFRIFWPHW